MAVSSLGITTSATAAAAPVWDLVAAATVTLRLMELHLFMSTAVATKLDLRRTSAIGTRTGAVTFMPEDPQDVATASSALAWSVAATLVAGVLRKFTAPATVGAGIIWTWGPRGLLIPKGLGLQLVNSAGAIIGLVDVTAVVDE